MDVTWNALVSDADGQLSHQQSGEFPDVSVLRCGHCTLNCTTPAGNVSLGENVKQKGPFVVIFVSCAVHFHTGRS